VIPLIESRMAKEKVVTADKDAIIDSNYRCPNCHEVKTHQKRSSFKSLIRFIKIMP